MFKDSNSSLGVEVGATDDHPETTSGDGLVSNNVTHDRVGEISSILQYYLNGPVCIFVAFFGILFNIMAITRLSMFISSKSSSRNACTFQKLVLSLAVWDLAYIILAMFCFSIPTVSEFYRHQYHIRMIPYVLPTAQICFQGSCYSTVAMTIERYITVCHPIKRHTYHITSRMFIIPVLLLAPLYSIPRFFEFSSEAKLNSDIPLMEHNGTTLAEDISVTTNYSNQTSIVQSNLTSQIFSGMTGMKGQVNDTMSSTETSAQSAALLLTLALQQQASADWRNGVNISRTANATSTSHELLLPSSESASYLMSSNTTAWSNEQGGSFTENVRRESGGHVGNFEDTVEGGDKWSYHLVISEWRRNVTYITVYVISVNWLMNILIPITILIILNIMTYRAIVASVNLSLSNSNNTTTNNHNTKTDCHQQVHNKLSKRFGTTTTVAPTTPFSQRMSTCTASFHQSHNNNKRLLNDREVSLTRISIAIVSVYIVCNVPRSIPNILELINQGQKDFILNHIVTIFVSFNNVLQIINCSVNCLIYYVNSTNKSRRVPVFSNLTCKFLRRSKPSRHSLNSDQFISMTMDRAAGLGGGGHSRLLVTTTRRASRTRRLTGGRCSSMAAPSTSIMNSINIPIVVSPETCRRHDHESENRTITTTSLTRAGAGGSGFDGKTATATVTNLMKRSASSTNFS